MANILPKSKQLLVMNLLSEGMSVRATERIADVSRETVLSLLVRVGEGCERLHDRMMVDLPCRYLELDEQWDFIAKKQKRVKATDDVNEVGDVWLWVAIDADTKLVPAYRVGKRDGANGAAFVADLSARLRGRVQISSDGLSAYVDSIEQAFGADVDYARVVKSFESEMSEGRYSPPKVSKVEKSVIQGRPNMDRASTAYVERFNLTTRMEVRRMTRLTNAHSKKLRNHAAAISFQIAKYNLVRRHETIRCTPAMEAGITSEMWSMERLLDAALAEQA